VSRQLQHPPVLQFSLHARVPPFRMSKPISASHEALSTIRTHVRIASVRHSPYSTNTCSIHRPSPKRRGAWSGRCNWCARSCCSRTTTVSTGRSIRKSAPSNLGSPPGIVMVVLTIALVCIRTGWLYGASWVRGARGLLRVLSRCAYALSASELAPECRAAPSRRRDLARTLRVSWGPHGTLNTDGPGSGVNQQRHEPPHGAARVLIHKPAASYSPRPLRAKYHRR
jgi:hypothetical protein